MEMPVQKEMLRERAKDGGVIPVTGFPWVSSKRGWPNKQRFDHGENMGISYNTSIHSRTVVLAVIPSKRAKYGSCSVQSRGSRCSRVAVGSSRSHFVVVHTL